MFLYTRMYLVHRKINLGGSVASLSLSAWE